MKTNAYDAWVEYVNQERDIVSPALASLGYALDETQPHVAGERYLMQAVTTTNGRKLILLGTRDDGTRVVVKATRDASGKRELRHERECRIAIHELPFAYAGFSSPKELYFGNCGEFLVSIQEYIAQESSFLERSLSEQFHFSLDAFKAQEGAHAATYEQAKNIKHLFGNMSSREYVRSARSFSDRVKECDGIDPDIHALLTEASTYLEKHSVRTDQYAGFLTHTDFVPHNFRIKDGTLYLLDYSSIRFGNKHEGWARFLNFMALHNPALESTFIQYFKENRALEECESLQAMRVYRLAEITWYYVRTLSRSEGNLYTLNAARVMFWADMLRSILTGTGLDSNVRATYIGVRDSLRSEEERERQRGLL